jgi:hypothetical protein
LALLVQYLRYCHSDCSVSFFHCSLFQLVVLHVGHVLASNCDLCFGYLLNFTHICTRFCSTYTYILCLSYSSIYIHFISVQRRTLAILVPSFHRFFTIHRLYHPTACVGKNLVRTW